MSSDSKPKKTELTLMEEDIKKGLKEKKVQNLILKKILAVVDPDRQGQPAGRKTETPSSKH